MSSAGVDSDRPELPKGTNFQTTHWSLVQRAGLEGKDAQNALSDLCRSYWYPLYAFVRAKGYSQQDAEDRTQGFLLQLLERGDLAKADQTRGKFRSYLLAALTNFLHSQWRKEKAQKRGGDLQFVEIDAEEGENRLSREPQSDRTPEDDFDRRWALATLDQAMGELQESYDAAGKRDLFESLKPGLAFDGEVSPYAELAEKLGLSIGAITMAAKRLRSRFAQCIRDEVMKTVDSEEAYQSEMDALYAALGTY